jgi:hypothetical protein
MTEIRTAKPMFTIMCNLLGFQVIDKLSDGVTMDANYFTENSLGPLGEKIFPDGRAALGRRRVVYMDNAHVHNCGMTACFLACHNMVRFQHQPYSPDLAPSHFYLFSTVKKLKDIEMVDEKDLFYRLQELLNDIPIRVLRKVFTVWIKRLVNVN